MSAAQLMGNQKNVYAELAGDLETKSDTSDYEG